MSDTLSSIAISRPDASPPPIHYQAKNPNAVEPDKAPLGEYGIILISARFDGGPREQEARGLQDELVKIGVDARMVESAVLQVSSVIIMKSISMPSSNSLQPYCTQYCTA
jgi:hypothetical protein